MTKSNVFHVLFITPIARIISFPKKFMYAWIVDNFVLCLLKYYRSWIIPLIFTDLSLTFLHLSHPPSENSTKRIVSVDYNQFIYDHLQIIHYTRIQYKPWRSHSGSLRDLWNPHTIALYFVTCSLLPLIRLNKFFEYLCGI